MLALAPGESVALDVRTAAETERGGRYVTAGAQPLPLPRAPTSSGLADNPAAALPRRVLYFQLVGQETPCGPVQLDREASSNDVVSLNTPGVSCLPLLVHSVARRRFGGSDVSVHSGVELVNETSLPLEVGMALEVHPAALEVGYGITIRDVGRFEWQFNNCWTLHKYMKAESQFQRCIGINEHSVRACAITLSLPLV